MDEGPVQDAVTFLDEARRVYPNVTHLLNTVQLFALEMNPQEPFTSGRENEEFVKLAEGYFVTKHCIYQAEVSLRQVLMEPQAKTNDWDVADEKLVIKCLEMVRWETRPFFDERVYPGPMFVLCFVQKFTLCMSLSLPCITLSVEAKSIFQFLGCLSRHPDFPDYSYQ